MRASCPPVRQCRGSPRRGGVPTAARAIVRLRVEGARTPVAVSFHPLAPQHDPYPIYRGLRDESPVHHSIERDIWRVTRT
jgi:hypothetical protein